MQYTPTDLLSFWTTPWSRPLRGACVWLASLGTPISGSQPDAAAPRWLRPLCLQRWVGQGVAARLAWMREHPDQPAYQFARDSEPCWTDVAWATYDRFSTRGLSEEGLLQLFGAEVERLLRSAEEAPGMVGAASWTRAVLGACEHVAQIYGELKRRHKAMRARAMLREQLQRYGSGLACAGANYRFLTVDAGG